MALLHDCKNENLKTYDCILIQFRNEWTKEVLNLGLLLLDGKGGCYTYLPNPLDRLSGCLSFEEEEGVEYTIEIVLDRLENQGVLPEGDISNSLCASEPVRFFGSENPEEAMREAVQNLMMLLELQDVGEDIAFFKLKGDLK